MNNVSEVAIPCIEALSQPGLRGYVTDTTGRALEWHSRGQRFDPAYLHPSPEIVRFQGFFAFRKSLRVRNMVWQEPQYFRLLVVSELIKLSLF